MDDTEHARRQRMAELEAERGDRAALEAKHGRVWDTDQLREEYDVTGFLAPFVVARRKSDGAVGSLEFQGSPRFYFNWQEDRK